MAHQLSEDEIQAMVSGFESALRSGDVTRIETQSGRVTLTGPAHDYKRFEPSGGREIRIVIKEGAVNSERPCDCDECAAILSQRRRRAITPDDATPAPIMRD